MAVVLELLLILVVLVGVAVVALIVRGRVLRARGATFDCAWRRPRGWSLGRARYAGDQLDWFSLVGVSLRPRYALSRRSAVALGQRPASGAEAATLMPGAYVVECLDAGVRVDLAMSHSAVTGFLSWLEAAPPGTHLGRDVA